MAASRLNGKNKVMQYAITFKSTDDFFNFLLGPDQQAAHVGDYRRHKKFKELKLWMDAADARVAAVMAKHKRKGIKI
jgi:hypothetical protein